MDLISSYSFISLNLTFVIPISCPWYINGVPLCIKYSNPNALALSFKNLVSSPQDDTTLVISWFSINNAFHPSFSRLTCHLFHTFFKFGKLNSELFHKSICSNWNSILNFPSFSPTQSVACSAFTPFASPTVIISYLLNVFSFNSLR